jgi:hypothetical protein
MRESIIASECQIVTVAVRRVQTNALGLNEGRRQRAGGIFVTGIYTPLLGRVAHGGNHASSSTWGDPRTGLAPQDRTRPLQKLFAPKPRGFRQGLFDKGLATAIDWSKIRMLDQYSHIKTTYRIAENAVLGSPQVERFSKTIEFKYLFFPLFKGDAEGRGIGYLEGSNFCSQLLEN